MKKENDVKQKFMHTCEVCKKQEKSGSPNLVNWQMQHLHFADAEISMLTCETCKMTDPIVFAELAEKKMSDEKGN